MQLVELGHGANGVGGISGRPPEEGNTVVKGLVQGMVQKRAGLSSACASLCHLGHSSNRTVVIQGTHAGLWGDPDCSAPKGPWFREQQEGVHGGEALLNPIWSLLRPHLEVLLPPAAAAGNLGGNCCWTWVAVVTFVLPAAEGSDMARKSPSKLFLCVWPCPPGSRSWGDTGAQVALSYHCR